MRSGGRRTGLTGPGRPLLGAHLSVQGGVSKAIARGADLRCDTIQIFTKNNLQWQAKPIPPDEVRRFAESREAARIDPILAHACYLINLASTDRAIAAKSRKTLAAELRNAEVLGLLGVIIHPGSHPDEANGIERIARRLRTLLDRTETRNTKLILETTAGQGSSIGRRFEQLAALLEGIGHPDRTGVCFDTCHVFAAGYDFRTERAYAQVMHEFDEVVGLRRLVAFHLNDSKQPLGSHVDRHEHIGRGHIGLEGFRCLMNDPRFAQVPKILETPKEDERSKEWDRKNLATLRQLVSR